MFRDVIKTGKPSTNLNKTCDRYEVNLPLFDASHRTVGVAFKYKAGEATDIRDRMARRISHVANEVKVGSRWGSIAA